MDPTEAFKNDCIKEVAAQGDSADLQSATTKWVALANAHKYSYHFEWLGRPIIQYPQDILAVQQLVWEVQPDLIIETGIAHGGSLILSASLLELNAACGGNPDARVLGLDIDIREHNRAAIEAHPMYKRIDMLEGSSIDPDIVAQVKAAAEGKQRVLVFLDSNHTHDHVLEELRAYAGLASVGSYCVVFDTIVEHLDPESWPDRPWGHGNSPKSAVFEYLKEDDRFEIDREMDNRILISVAPEGFLKRTK